MKIITDSPLVFLIPGLIGGFAIWRINRLFNKAIQDLKQSSTKECDHIFSIYSSFPTLRSSCMLCHQEHPDSGKFPGQLTKLSDQQSHT